MSFLSKKCVFYERPGASGSPPGPLMTPWPMTPMAPMAPYAPWAPYGSPTGPLRAPYGSHDTRYTMPALITRRPSLQDLPGALHRIAQHPG